MKISKSQLKQIIKEEISAVTENKQAHIAGIAKKIVRLKQAILNAEKGMQNMTAGAVDDMDLQDIMTNNAYWAKQTEVMNLNDKVELLKKQLDQLDQDSPGQLARGLEENLGEDASPEAQQLYKQGQELFGKLIEMGKNDHREAGDILDALDEWASETSFEYVRIKSLY